MTYLAAKLIADAIIIGLIFILTVIMVFMIMHAARFTSDVVSEDSK